MPPLGPENIVERIYPTPTEEEVELKNRIEMQEGLVHELMVGIMPVGNKFLPQRIRQSAIAHYEISDDGSTHQAAWLERRGREVILFTETYEARDGGESNKYYRTSNPAERVRVFDARGGGPGFIIEDDRLLWKTTAHKQAYDEVLVEVLDTLVLIKEAQTAKNLGALATDSGKEYYRSWHLTEI